MQEEINDQNVQVNEMNDPGAALAERENELVRRELRLEVTEKLSAAGLPRQLAGCIDYSDREKCEQSYIAATNAFSEAVSKSVSEYFSSNTPRRASAPLSDPFLAGLGFAAAK